MRPWRKKKENRNAMNECRMDERIDDLQRNGYRIIQKKTGFHFGTDAVLLSDFACVKAGERVLDLGTGSGVIPILMEARSQGAHFTGLEIQTDLADMAARSVRLNGLEDCVEIVLGDIKEASRICGRASFDVITANPPYMTGSHGLENPDPMKAIARHELLCTFADVARETEALLRPGGRFYLVHRPRRLAELISTMREYHLEPKRLRFVYPFADRMAKLVLIEAVRGGGVMLKVEPPLVVFREPGIYSEEITAAYGN